MTAPPLPRDARGSRPIGVLDRRPQRVEHRQVVVRMVDVVGAPHRLAGEGQRAKAELGHALDFDDGTLEIGGGDGRRRRHAMVVAREDLPRPFVVDAALGHGEGAVGRGPHRQPLVGEDHLGVDAVAIHVAQPLLGLGAGQLPQAVLALELIGAQAVRAMALGDPPLHSVGVDDDARYPLAILGVDPGGPQIGRLVGVSVGGDDEILPGIADPRAARPAGVAGSLRAPDVGLVDGQLTRAHRFALQCTSVNSGVASSWASNTASTGASI